MSKPTPLIENRTGLAPLDNGGLSIPYCTATDKEELRERGGDIGIKRH